MENEDNYRVFVKHERYLNHSLLESPDELEHIIYEGDE